MRPSISELLALPGSWIVNNPKKLVLLMLLVVLAVVAALSIYPGGVSQY